MICLDAPVLPTAGPGSISWLLGQASPRPPVALFNPRTPPSTRQALASCLTALPSLTDHVLVATSGSTALDSKDIKWVALKTQGIVASAHSVNAYLQCTPDDVFGNVLPHFHVGGLGLLVRAFLCGARVVELFDQAWEAGSFVAALAQNQVSITSLVPTQVHDLVTKRLQAPPSLRCVVVGGAALHPTLCAQAQALGWPLRPSYGMTECASQIATSPVDPVWQDETPALVVLPHVSVRLTAEGCIALRSASLLTGYVVPGSGTLVDPKIEGELITHDRGLWQDGRLLVLGRADDTLKILGENVSLVRLHNTLHGLLASRNSDMGPWAIVPVPCTRRGYTLALAATNRDLHAQWTDLITHFNQQVMPFERLQTQACFLDRIPQTDLGKIKKNALQHMVCSALTNAD